MYRKVICIDLCPSSSFTVKMSAPDISSRLANVCRRSWNRKSLMPARWHPDANEWCRLWKRFPRIFRDGLVAVSDGAALVLSLDTDDPDVDIEFDDLRVFVVKWNGNFQ